MLTTMGFIHPPPLPRASADSSILSAGSRATIAPRGVGYGGRIRAWRESLEGGGLAAVRIEK
jgi:hypothetical protein